MVVGDQSTPDSKKAAKEKADQAFARLEAGADFAELAKAMSEDNTSASKGGDLGWVRYNVLDTALRDAANALSVGEYSKVLSTAQGYEIIFAEEKKARRQKTFDEVRANLEQALKKEDAPEYAKAEAEEIFDTWMSAADTATLTLESLAKERALDVVLSSKPLTAGESEAGFPRELVIRVNELSEGAREVIDVGESSFVVEVTKVVDSHVPEYAKVAEKVKARYKQAKAADAAKAAANEALASLHEDPKATLAAIAEKHQLKVETTAPATRTLATGPLFMMPDSKRIAFSLSKTRPLPDEPLTVGNNQYVLRVLEETAPDQEAFSGKKKELLLKAREKTSRRVLEALLKELRSRSEIWVNPSLLETQSA